MGQMPLSREAQLNLPALPGLVRDLFLDSTDGIVYVDVAGRFVEVNPRACDMLDYSREELLALPVAETLKGRDLTAAGLPLLLSQLGASSPRGEYTLYRRDGTAREVEIDARPGSDGGWLGIVRDSKDQYRPLFNTMQEGFALHQMIYDEAGKPVDYRFVQVNPAFERLTGLRAVDIVGKTARQVLPNIEQSWIDTYGQVSLTGKQVFF